MSAVISLLGIIVLFLIAYLSSTQRSAINWRTVGLALLLQFSLGGIVLYLPAGVAMLSAVSNAVTSVLGNAQDGIAFVFGPIGAFEMGFIFAFHVLPVIVFFSALVSVLYYLGIMGWIIRVIGGALQRLLKTSKAESMSATANIFVGQTEAPLVVKPYIPSMTRSELFAVMVGGMASIAGSVMAGYVALGVPLEYLLAASFMAAPGGLLMAKLMEPETDTPAETEQGEQLATEKYINFIDAAATGAMNGLQMVGAIGAMLLAFIALIAMVNGMLEAGGAWVGIEQLTLERVLGGLLQPLAWALGIPWDEAQLAGSLIGQKFILNEFVAYVSYSEVAGQLSPHAQAIVIFALCGFANLSSIAILLGGLGAVAPGRRDDISRYGFRALIAASLSNLMSAALAGFFLTLGAA